MIRAILSHAMEITGVTRDSLLEKTLFACDEMAGFHHRGVAGAAEQEHPRSRGEVGDQADEGQSVRPCGQAATICARAPSCSGCRSTEHITNVHHVHARARRCARAARQPVADLFARCVRISEVNA